MLEYAAELYNGPLDLANAALSQGSYSSNGPASFGTHLGGGAIDISVIEPDSIKKVMYVEIEPAIRALRVAGFAAWVRDTNELMAGSPIHIHAIAIGDRELSLTAREQLTGTAGYFAGYAGVPAESGPPALDRHGGPIVCAWMRALGYTDTRPLEQQTFQAMNWQTSLKEAAQKYVAATYSDTIQIAFQVDFRPGNNEDPSNMCGPLAGAILRDAGLLPPGLGPWQAVKNFWLANPQGDGRPWTFFSRRDYDVYHFDTATNQFDFIQWPLRPGDFLYTYQERDGYEHMFIVTEVDEQGRAYTITNNKQRDLTYIVQRVLLYDPTDLTAGAFKNDWANSPHVGRTGMKGFDVLRRKGVSLPDGTEYVHTVAPGDTLLSLVAHFNSTPEALLERNQLNPAKPLLVGQKLIVTVNIGQAR